MIKLDSSALTKTHHSVKPAQRISAAANSVQQAPPNSVQQAASLFPIYAELDKLTEHSFFIVCTRALLPKLTVLLDSNKTLQSRPILLINTPDTLNEVALEEFVSAAQTPLDAIVLVSEWGSVELYQTIRSWKSNTRRKVSVFDSTAQVLGNHCFYEGVPLQKYVIVYSLNPIDQYPMWLNYIEKWLAHCNIQLVLRHPFQEINIEFHQQSEGVLLWNGSLNTFDHLKHTLKHFDIKFSFVECGFFTQREHIYFDKQGINLHSSLANDKLNWVPDNYADMVDCKAQQLFKDVEPYNAHKNYIFIPLQLGHDSNIQLNSPFTNGMQEFIDFIEAKYPQETLVFKAHPLDSNKYTLRNHRSYWSTAHSFSLIKSAKQVHGINSTVLFESTLFKVPTVFEGNSLLVQHSHQPQKLLAALLCKQLSINGPNMNIEQALLNISDNSYINLDTATCN